MRKIILFIPVLLIASIKIFSQNVGIGTTTPIGKLEVKGTGSSSLTNNLILRNSTGDTLLRVRDDGRMTLSYNGTSVGRTMNLGGNGLNFYKTNTIFGGAIFPTDTSIVMWSQIEDNNYVILQPSWGKVGIGTFSPKAKFHVRNNPSGAIPVSTAITVFEDNTDMILNMLTPSGNYSGIQFGFPGSPVDGGILYNHSTLLNGLSFRTNGNITRMVISDAGKVGIGTLTPATSLHVSDGIGGGVYNSSAELVIEDNNNSYLQFSTLTTKESGILAGNEFTSIRSALIFRLDSAVSIRTGGNNTRIVVDNNGNVGFGNIAPSFQLHLSTNSAAKPTSSSWTVPSDTRLKQDVHDFNDGLEEVLKIHPVWFTYTGEAGMPHETGIGVLAQELQKVSPYMVGTWNYKDENGNSTPYLSVNNGAMTYMLINAVKEQQLKIDEQQKQIEVLFNEVNELKQLMKE